MIIGHGVDLVEHDSFSVLITKEDTFLKRCFTDNEIQEARATADTIQWYASRFAAKEAVMKALGTGWSQGISWHDIQLRSEDGNSPEVVLSGRAQEVAASLGISRVILSLSHAKHASIASVIAV
jgi:holo-[acyl-carrier protein] synthase